MPAAVRAALYAAGPDRVPDSQGIETFWAQMPLCHHP